MAPFIVRSLGFVLVCLVAASKADASPLAYIANADDNTMSVIDTDTNTIVKTITGLGHPVHVALNAAGTRLYVTNTTSSPPLLQIFNAQSNIHMATLQVPAFAGTFFTNLVLNPTQPFGYLGYIPDKIFVFDAGSNAPATPITVPVSGGDEIRAIAVNPAGTKIYATKAPSGDISVIDAATGLEITTIAGGGLADVAVDPTGAFVYAVGETLPNARDLIIVSDAATNMVVDSEPYPSCTFLRGLTFDASGATLYAACGSTNEVAVIDTATLAAVEVPVGFVPLGTSLTPDGAFLYVTNQVSNDVSVIDTSTNTVVDTIPVGDEPTSIGKFIGPNFVCGNNVLEPGEGCDDGNVADGDDCSSTCYTVVDAALSLAKPTRFTIPSGNGGGGKNFKTKLRNLDDVPHSFVVNVHTDCVNAYGFTNFGPGGGLPFTIDAGASVTGVVTVGAFANTQTQLNYEAPARCTYTMTAFPSLNGYPLDFTVDATPSNNVAVFEADITDENQAEMTTLHETKILAAKPLKMKIKDGAASATKTIKFKVGNADYLPSPEPAASHSITVTGADGDCPAMTVGTPTFGGNASADVEGGDTASAEVSVTVNAADFDTPSKTTPARCAITLTAAGPPGDTVTSNDSATVMIDVLDLNDF